MSARVKGRKAAKKVDAADVAAAKLFAPLHDSPVVRAIGTASEVGDQPPLYALSGGVFVAGLLTGDRRTAKAGLRMLAAHFVAIRIKNLVKRLVDRTRPKVAVENGRYKLGKGERYISDYNSFPSGHTASSLAVARALGRDYPGVRAGSLSVAGSIAAIQVVRGKHYVGDLVAGAAIGLVAEYVAHRWLEKMNQP